MSGVGGCVAQLWGEGQYGEEVITSPDLAVTVLLGLGMNGVSPCPRW